MWRDSAKHRCEIKTWPKLNLSNREQHKTRQLRHRLITKTHLFQRRTRNDRTDRKCRKDLRDVKNKKKNLRKQTKKDKVLFGKGSKQYFFPEAETASRVVVSSNQNSMLTKRAVKRNSVQCNDGRTYGKQCKCKADGAIQFEENFTSGGTYRLHLPPPPHRDGQLQHGGGALAVPCCPDLVSGPEAA